jgi:type IV fimbrial biogenesis protein FimT
MALMCSLPRANKAVTLVELLAALAVMAILAMVATPSLATLMQGTQVRSQTDAVLAGFALARSEAVHRRMPVIICPGKHGIACDRAASWQEGWFVAPDPHRDSRRLGEPIWVHQGTASPSIRGISTRPYSRFYPDGTSRGHNLTVVFCATGKPDTAQAVVLATSGRARQQAKHTAHALACAHAPSTGS